MLRILKIAAAIVGVAAIVALVLLFQNPEPGRTVSFTQYMAMQNRVRSATIRGDAVSGRDEAGKPFSTFVPSGSAEAARLAQRGIDVTYGPATPDAAIGGYIVLAVNGLWLVITLWYFHRITRALERLGGRNRRVVA